MEKHLQLPDQLSCSIDLATATGKSWVLYGIAAILLAEGAADRALVLCPSNTIEAGLMGKFRSLAGDANLRDQLPKYAKVRAPKIINASETIVNESMITRVTKRPANIPRRVNTACWKTGLWTCRARSRRRM
jgi:type III restriction enzyme